VARRQCDHDRNREVCTHHSGATRPPLAARPPTNQVQVGLLAMTVAYVFKCLNGLASYLADNCAPVSSQTAAEICGHPDTRHPQNKVCAWRQRRRSLRCERMELAACRHPGFIANCCDVCRTLVLSSGLAHLRTFHFALYKWVHYIKRRMSVGEGRPTLICMASQNAVVLNTDELVTLRGRAVLLYSCLT